MRDEELFHSSFETHNMPRIFISHSNADNNFCTQLVHDLRVVLSDESAVWYDMQGGLRAGDVWWDKILGELSTRNICIVVLSPDAMKSRWVLHEINIALNRNMTIIPLLYRDYIIPADLQTFKIVSFLPHKANNLAFKELLLALGIPLDKEANKSKFEDPKAVMVQEMLLKIEAAFTKSHWHDVIRKVNYLIKHVPSYIPAVAYRMQALSLYEIGYKLLALEALDVALALVSEEAVYSMLLGDYAAILTSLSRWVDLLRIADEALQLVPNDVRWLAIEQQAYTQLEQSSNIEESFTPSQSPSKPGKRPANGNKEQKKRVFISYSHKNKRYLDRHRCRTECCVKIKTKQANKEVLL